MIGPEGSEASESFDLIICNDKWIVQECAANGFVFERFLFIMNDFNLDMFKKKIEDICKSSSGNSWEEISSKLSRIAKYEFEDYRM